MLRHNSIFRDLVESILYAIHHSLLVEHFVLGLQGCEYHLGLRTAEGTGSSLLVDSRFQLQDSILSRRQTPYLGNSTLC